jgi:hypothetical protein
VEILSLSSQSLRIKSKAATLAIEPMNLKSKVVCDGVLSFTFPVPELSVEENPVVLFGPGEFEVKGLKIDGIGKTTLIGFEGKI